MAADNILEILAEANFGPMNQGIEASAATVQTATTGMQGWFSKLAASTAEAASSISKSMLGAAEHVAEASSEMKEKLLETAEAAELSAGGIGGAFSGLGALLGVGIVGEMFNHLMEGVEETAIHMEHLAAKTGLTVDQLSALAFSAKLADVSMESLEQGLLKQSVSQAKAVAGSEAQVKAYESLGISAKDLKEMKPEEVIYAIADALDKSEDPWKHNAALRDIYGRGFAGMLPVLREGSAALKEQAEQNRRLGGVMQESTIESAKQLHEEEVKLSTFWTGNLRGVFEGWVTFLKYIAAGAIEAKAGFEIMGSFIRVMVAQLLISFEGLGNVLDLLFHRKFKEAMAAAEDTSKQMGQTWGDVWDDNTRVAATALTAVDALFEKSKEHKERLDDDFEGDTRDHSKDIMAVWENELKAKADAENAMHTMSAAQELAFWQEKLENTKAGSKLYMDVQNKIFDLDKKIAEDTLKLWVTNEREKEEQFKRGSQQRVDIETAILAHMKALGLEGTEAYAQQQQRIAALTREVSETITREAKKRNDELFKQGSEYVDGVRKNETDMLEAARYRFTTEAEMGKMGAAQKTATLKAMLADQYKIELGAIQQKVELYKSTHTQDPANPSYLADLQKFYAQIAALKGKFYKDSDKLDVDLAKDEKKRWDGHFTFLKSGYANALQNMIVAHQTFGQVVGGIGQAILGQFVDMLAQEMVELTAHLAAKLGMQRAVQAIEHALHLTGLATKKATASAAAAAQITSDAAVAYAGAFAWMAAMYPPAAPAAGAAASTAVLAMLPMAMFEQGGIVPNTGVALVHQGEGIMNRTLTEKVTSMVDGKGGKSGGDIHLHYAPNVQALDGPGVQKVLKTNSREVVRFLRSELKDMGVI